MLRVAQLAQQAALTDVFLGEEQHLLRSSRRHAKCARLLLEAAGLLDEADYHAHLAAECILKHIFCLVRHSLGARTGLPPDFGSLKTARNFGHDTKHLVRVLREHDVELKAYGPIGHLETRLDSGDKWTEVRYRESRTGPDRAIKIREIIEDTEQIARDVEGGTDAP